MNSARPDNRGRPMHGKRAQAIGMFGAMTYADIAKTLDCSAETVRGWARQSGFRSPRSHLPADMRGRILALAGTMTDGALASIVGCCSEAVRRIRVEAKIRAYRKHADNARSRNRRPPTSPVPEEQRVGAWALRHDLPFTSRDYATAVGVAHITARNRISRALADGSVVRVPDARGLYVTP